MYNKELQIDLNSEVEADFWDAVDVITIESSWQRRISKYYINVELREKSLWTDVIWKEC